MNSNKKLLLLGAGQMQVPIIEKALEYSSNVIVCDYDSKAAGFSVPSIQKEIVSTIDKEAVLKVAQDNNINGILTTSDFPVRTVAYVASKLKLNAMSENVAIICTDKYKQREIFNQFAVNIPQYKLISDKRELLELIDYPYIVKPVDSSASRGVARVDNLSEMESAYEFALQYSNSKKVIVEQFIEGREFSIETLSQNGTTTIIAITEKLLNKDSVDAFVEDAHIIPARITEDEVNLIKTEVMKGITAAGVDNCPTHTEVKLYNAKVYIIEMACRLGGDYITSHLVPLSTGVSMMDNLIKIALGESIDTNHTKNDYAVVQYVNHSNYELMASAISQIKDKKFKYQRNIAEYHLELKHDKEIKSSLDRMGYIIFSASTKHEMEEILQIINIK